MRIIDGLALSGNAPRIFAMTMKRNGLPFLAVLVSVAFALLAFMGTSAGSGKV